MRFKIDQPLRRRPSVPPLGIAAGDFVGQRFRVYEAIVIESGPKRWNNKQQERPLPRSALDPVSMPDSGGPLSIVMERGWNNAISHRHFRQIPAQKKSPAPSLEPGFVIFRQTTSYCMMPGSGMQLKLQHPDSVRDGTPRGVGARMRPETGVRPGACSAPRSSSAPPPGSRFQARRSRRRRSSGGSRSPGRESHRRR